MRIRLRDIASLVAVAALAGPVAAASAMPRPELDGAVEAAATPAAIAGGPASYAPQRHRVVIAGASASVCAHAVKPSACSMTARQVRLAAETEAKGYLGLPGRSAKEKQFWPWVTDFGR
jgi:hypothetical protein